jgi:hypothetical protein
MLATRSTEQFEELTSGYGLIFVSNDPQHFIQRIRVTASNPRLSERMLQRVTRQRDREPLEWGTLG